MSNFICGVIAALAILAVVLGFVGYPILTLESRINTALERLK